MRGNALTAQSAPGEAAVAARARQGHRGRPLGKVVQEAELVFEEVVVEEVVEQEDQVEIQVEVQVVQVVQGQALEAQARLQMLAACLCAFGATLAPLTCLQRREHPRGCAKHQKRAEIATASSLGLEKRASS